MRTFLETTRDMLWLKETHKISTEGFKCAILTSREDCPEKVELYEVNDYRCKPVVYIADGDGRLILSVQTN